MIGEWINLIKDKASSWFGWKQDADDRILYNLSAAYVAAVERGNRKLVEQSAANIKLPWRERNRDKLAYSLDVVYRRVPKDRDDPTRNDGSVGGCYRTMTAEQFEGSVYEQRAKYHYATILADELLSVIDYALPHGTRSKRLIEALEEHGIPHEVASAATRDKLRTTSLNAA